MAKLNREARLRERRVEKAARKVERKQLAELGPQPDDPALADGQELDSDPEAEQGVSNPKAEQTVSDPQADQIVSNPEAVSTGK